MSRRLLILADTEEDLEREENGEGESDEEEQPKQKPKRGRKRKDSDDEESYSERADGAEKHKKKKKKTKAAEDDEEEDTFEMIRRRRQSRLSPEDREKLVGDTMRCILFSDAKKHPIRRTEIIKEVVKEFRDDKQLSAQLLAEAKTRLHDIFGFELIEMTRKTAQPVIRNQQGSQTCPTSQPSSQTPTAQSRGEKKTFPSVYLLRNTIQSEQLHELIDIGEKKAQYALLMIILSILDLNNNKITQDELWEHLSKLGMTESIRHPVFGDWEKLIEVTFVREHYLKRTRIDASPASKSAHEYSIAERTVAELNKGSVQAFIAEVSGVRTDPLRAKEMELEERQRAKQAKKARPAVSRGSQRATQDG